MRSYKKVLPILKRGIQSRQQRLLRNLKRDIKDERVFCIAHRILKADLKGKPERRERYDNFAQKSTAAKSMIFAEKV